MAPITKKKGAAKRKNTAPGLQQLERRWGKSLTDAGWTALPNVVLERQAALALKPTHLSLVLQIAKYWWEAESAPFPAVGTLAEAIGLTPRTVQKNLAEMEKMGFIEKTARYHSKGGQKTNEYTFEGLISKCEPFAKEITKARAKKKREEKARRKRKSPMPS